MYMHNIRVSLIEMPSQCVLVCMCVLCQITNVVFTVMTIMSTLSLNGRCRYLSRKQTIYSINPYIYL